MYVGFCSVDVPVLSPKSQFQFIIVPLPLVDRFVNVVGNPSQTISVLNKAIGSHHIIISEVSTRGHRESFTYKIIVKVSQLLNKYHGSVEFSFVLFTYIPVFCPMSH